MLYGLWVKVRADQKPTDPFDGHLHLLKELTALTHRSRSVNLNNIGRGRREGGGGREQNLAYD